MMPCTPRRDSRRQPNCPRGRAGFTLTEMLVVIGIVVLVLSIAVPMGTRAWKQGDRTRMQADLAAIAAALEAYKTDHGDYPRVTSTTAFQNGPTDYSGARMLCRALVAPGPGVSGTGTTTQNDANIADGAGTKPANAATGAAETEPGPGFRTRGTSGPVYGPYLPPDRFKLGDATGEGRTAPGYLALLDRYNRPILYYAANGKPNVRIEGGFVGTWEYKKGAAVKIPMYNATDNAAFPLGQLAPMLGDLSGDGRIDGVERPATDKPYLLWSAGPDETFGPDTGIMNSTNPNKVAEAVRKSDDVTNFQN